MCDFIGWSIADSDPETWGNFLNVQSSTFTGYCAGDNSSNWVYKEDLVKVKTDENNTTKNRYVFPTGKFVNADGGNTAKKNIFDIAGNAWEWTTEVPQYNGNNRVRRGGAVGSNSGAGLATRRYGYNSQITYTNSEVSFRIVLYVK